MMSRSKPIARALMIGIGPSEGSSLVGEFISFLC